jgi:hypothetical protein
MSTPLNISPSNIPTKKATEFNPHADVNKAPPPPEDNRGYYLGKKVNTPANLAGYVSDSGIPSMLQDPESVDDLLDVPSFQRPKITQSK